MEHHLATWILLGVSACILLTGLVIDRLAFGSRDWLVIDLVALSLTLTVSAAAGTALAALI
jgi:hypothetical protein